MSSLPLSKCLYQVIEGKMSGHKPFSEIKAKAVPHVPVVDIDLIVEKAKHLGHLEPVKKIKQPEPVTESPYQFTEDVIQKCLDAAVPFDENIPNASVAYWLNLWDGCDLKSFWDIINISWCKGIFSNLSFEEAFKRFGSVSDDGYQSRLHRILGVFQQYREEGIIAPSARYKIMPDDPEMPGTAAPQTQKAKGIKHLPYINPTSDWRPLPHVVFTNSVLKRIIENKPFEDKKTLTQFMAQVSIPFVMGRVFARPCPKTPRHGFVDSRFMRVEGAMSWNTLQAAFAGIAQEVLDADPEGELVLMRPVAATHNMVLTPVSLTIGPSNDGATGGHDSIELGTSAVCLHLKGTKDTAGIDVKDTIFVEGVARVQRNRLRPSTGNSDLYQGLIEQDLYVTQLRGGPFIQGTGNYVPHSILLDPEYAIYPAEVGDSLLAWEKAIATIRAKPDWKKYFVVHAGGAISSHFGVHSFLNEIPYLIEEVKWNTTLEPNAKAKKVNFEKVLSGFEKGSAKAFVPPGNVALRIALAALHNYPCLDMAQACQAEFFGLGVGIAMRLSMAAILGEARYGYMESPDLISIGHDTHLAREQVYAIALGCDLNYILRKAHRVTPMFGHKSWFTNDSVGGKRWLECAAAAFKLWNAFCGFVAKPNKTTLRQIVARLNRVINICHNANKMLTKFGSASHFTNAAASPYLPLTATGAVVYDLLKGEQRETVCYEPFTLPNQLWDINTIRKMRSQEAKAKVLAKTKAKTDLTHTTLQPLFLKEEEAHA